MSSYRTPIDAVALRPLLAGAIPDDKLDAFLRALAERDRALEDYLNAVDLQVYAQQATVDFVSAANVETTIVTLGTQTYRGGRTYEIRGMVSVKADNALTRGLVRILNATDSLRVNIFDDTFPGQLNAYKTFSAIYEFQPSQDVDKEFRITGQNAAGAVGNFTVCGSPPGVNGAVAALLTANQVGGAS